MIEAADYRSRQTRGLVKYRMFHTKPHQVGTRPLHEILIPSLGRGQGGEARAAGVGRAGWGEASTGRKNTVKLLHRASSLKSLKPGFLFPSLKVSRSILLGLGWLHPKEHPQAGARALLLLGFATQHQQGLGIHRLPRKIPLGWSPFVLAAPNQRGAGVMQSDPAERWIRCRGSSATKH